MSFTEDIYLPTYEDLTVQEVNISTPYLKAAAFHLGKECEAINNEYMLCRKEEQDPRKCLKEGKAVTACTLKFFQMVKSSCADELNTYAHCLDQSSSAMEMRFCRNTQAIFDSCMLTKLGISRPHYGYHSEARVHITDRPKPPPPVPPIYADAPLQVPPCGEGDPKYPAKYGARLPMGS